jgi:comEA protein
MLLLSAALIVGHGIRSFDLLPAPTAPDEETVFDYRALDSIFLARSESVHGASLSLGGQRPHDTSGARPVNINTADATALAALPGIGPVYARRIVAYREAHGPFRSVDDLLEVSGIGRKRLGALRSLVVLH